MIRKELNLSRYLEKYDAIEQLETINGVCLDEHLSNFTFLAEKITKSIKQILLEVGIP